MDDWAGYRLQVSLFLCARLSLRRLFATRCQELLKAKRSLYFSEAVIACHIRYLGSSIYHSSRNGTDLARK